MKPEVRKALSHFPRWEAWESRYCTDMTQTTIKPVLELKTFDSSSDVFPIIPGGLQRRRRGKRRFVSWVGKISWRRKWQPTAVFLLGEAWWAIVHRVAKSQLSNWVHIHYYQNHWIKGSSLSNRPEHSTFISSNKSKLVCREWPHDQTREPASEDQENQGQTGSKRKGSWVRSSS